MEKVKKSNIITNGCWIEERPEGIFLCVEIPGLKKKDLYIKRIKITMDDWSTIVDFKKIVDRELWDKEGNLLPL